MRELLYPVIVKYPVTGIIPGNVCVCVIPLKNYTFSHLRCAKVTTFLIHNCPQSGRFE